MDEEEIYIDMQNQEKKLKYELKQQRKKVNKQYREEHKTWFRLMDIAVILAILFNIGALVITNALVLKAEPQKVFYEANPAQAEARGWETNDEGKFVYGGVLFHIFIVALILGSYIYQRFSVTNQHELMAITFTVLVLIFGCTLDFGNDLGYMIGKWIWGV